MVIIYVHACRYISSYYVCSYIVYVGGGQRKDASGSRIQILCIYNIYIYVYICCLYICICIYIYYLYVGCGQRQDTNGSRI